MSNESYTSQLEAPSSPEVVHQALTKELPLWWTQKVEPSGDTFTVFFGETHKTFSVEIEPYTTGSFRLVWNCTDANLLHPDVSDPTEWIGTQIIWDVSKAGLGSSIRLTHKGLNNTFQCHEICVGGWDFFFQDSLKNYLETGVGKPFEATT